jgi:hypothetical protein
VLRTGPQLIGKFPSHLRFRSRPPVVSGPKPNDRVVAQGLRFRGRAREQGQEFPAGGNITNAGNPAAEAMGGQGRQRFRGRASDQSLMYQAGRDVTTNMAPGTPPAGLKAGYGTSHGSAPGCVTSTSASRGWQHRARLGDTFAAAARIARLVHLAVRPPFG